MASIDLNKLFQQYVNQFGGDTRKAARYTAFQYLANPSGSVSALKQPETWYSLDEWYDYNAPSYSAIVNYKGDPNQLDALTKFTAEQLKPYKGKTLNLTDLSKIAQKAVDDGVLSETNYGPQDYYNQLKDLYTEKTAAEKAYERQKNTHVFSQFGLNPEVKYSFKNDPANNLVAYQPAVDYLTKKGNERYNALIKRGIKPEQAKAYTAAYTYKLGQAVQSKLDASGLDPFIDQVYAKARIRKP
jgi:hypothetical protein